MKRVFFIILLSVMAISQSSIAAEEDVEPNASYVSISFELYGLQESATLLNQALVQIASTIEELGDTTTDSTPEQIEALANLTAQINELVSSFQNTLTEIEPAIERAKDPTIEIIEGIISTTMEKAVNPALENVDGTITKSIWFAAVVLSFLCIGLILFAYLSLKPIRSISQNLMNLGAQYRIVHVSNLENKSAQIAPETSSK